MIKRISWLTAVTISKISIGDCKTMNHTSIIRRATAPADTIALRCNHSTSHVKGRSRAANGLRQDATNMPKNGMNQNIFQTIFFGATSQLIFGIPPCL